MKKIDLLKEQKKLLHMELKTVSSPTRKEEIVDKILSLEQEILRESWEASKANNASGNTDAYALSPQA